MENMNVINENAFSRIEEKMPEEMQYHKHSVWQDIKKEMLDNKAALIASILLLIIVVASLLAPLSPYNPDALDVANKLQGSSSAHWFGTDDYGRDYFTRVLYGGRISLLVGFCSAIITIVVGTAIGVCSGYIGGKVDTLLMRITDIFLASVARITRAETMSVKERDYVIATRNLGAGSLRVTVMHIIPNIMGPVVVAASLAVANAILTESSLSFLGLGVQIPQASWGSMLMGAMSHIMDAPLLTVYPGMMILLTVLSFNLLGDVLRVALEPKIVK